MLHDGCRCLRSCCGAVCVLCTLAGRAALLLGLCQLACKGLDAGLQRFCGRLLGGSVGGVLRRGGFCSSQRTFGSLRSRLHVSNLALPSRANSHNGIVLLCLRSCSGLLHLSLVPCVGRGEASLQVSDLGAERLCALQRGIPLTGRLCSCLGRALLCLCCLGCLPFLCLQLGCVLLSQLLQPRLPLRLRICKTPLKARGLSCTGRSHIRQLFSQALSVCTVFLQLRGDFLCVCVEQWQ